MAKPKFPKEILVTVEEDSGEQYMIAHYNATTAANVGERVTTAKYRLVEIGVTVSAPEFVKG